MTTHQTRPRVRRRADRLRWPCLISLLATVFALTLLVRLVILLIPPALLPWIIDGMCAAVVLLTPPCMLILLVSAVISLDRSLRRPRRQPGGRSPVARHDHAFTNGDRRPAMPGDRDSR